MNLHGSAISFPFRVDARGTFVVATRRDDVVADAIRDVIETRRGERVMMPDYGIRDFVFAVQDFSFGRRLAGVIEDQLKKYVPLVKSVRATSEMDEEGRSVVNIRYEEVGSVNAPRNLVYPVWRLMNGET